MLKAKEIALAKKGQFACMEWVKTCKTKKGCPITITKQTTANNIRIGCQYDNMQIVKDGRKNGDLPAENQGLHPSLEWVAYPYLLRNKYNGNEYIRLETAQNTKFTTRFFANGKEVDKAEIENYLLASEKSKGERPTVMNINIENIQYIK